jgi:hypothetical protein
MVERPERRTLGLYVVYALVCVVLVFAALRLGPKADDPAASQYLLAWGLPVLLLALPWIVSVLYMTKIRTPAARP